MKHRQRVMQNRDTQGRNPIYLFDFIIIHIHDANLRQIPSNGGALQWSARSPDFVHFMSSSWFGWITSVTLLVRETRIRNTLWRIRRQLNVGDTQTFHAETYRKKPCRSMNRRGFSSGLSIGSFRDQVHGKRGSRRNAGASDAQTSTIYPGFNSCVENLP